MYHQYKSWMPWVSVPDGDPTCLRLSPLSPRHDARMGVSVPLCQQQAGSRPPHGKTFVTGHTPQSLGIVPKESDESLGILKGSFFLTKQNYADV